MSLQQIREYYRVPAFAGARVMVDGNPGVITGSDPTTLHLRVRFDGKVFSVPAHPTWRVTYLPPDPAQ